MVMVPRVSVLTPTGIGHQFDFDDHVPGAFADNLDVLQGSLMRWELYDASKARGLR